MDLARAPRRAPLTARKKGSGYENGVLSDIINSLHVTYMADMICRKVYELLMVF